MDSYPVLLGLKPANCGFDVFVAVALSSTEKLPFPLQDLCSSPGIDPPSPAFPPSPAPPRIKPLEEKFKKVRIKLTAKTVDEDPASCKRWISRKEIKSAKI